MTTVDAHLHLWDLEHGGYTWLSDAVAPINRTFGWSEASAQLREAGVDRAVLVQAANTAEDTAAMFAVAGAAPAVAGVGSAPAVAGAGSAPAVAGAGSAPVVAGAGSAPAVAGVVGWVDLLEPERVPEALDRWAAAGPLVGIRHLIHDEPDPDWLALEQVRRSLAVLASLGLAYDVIGVLPRHLELAVALADELPDLHLVIDHLGTPPVGGDADGSAWAGLIAELGARPNVFLKLSGLTTLGPTGSAAAPELRPFVARALDAFGPSRILYGGDWPVSTLATPYAETYATTLALLDGLSETERADVLGGTAARAYGLTP